MMVDKHESTDRNSKQHAALPTVSAGGGQSPRDAPDAPSRIGQYRIREQIGEGGMGVVYLAEQTEPVRRRVAVKLVKLGMDTKAVVARFESERQALAMMNHPNVAAVYDAGATEHGRPYFAMEYVPGVSITKFCDTQRLTMPERLELFTQVCGAIQHAHQKGIIHRDIKPSNVLVMRRDGQPVPKVIDFGVAKATDQRLTEQTLYTEHGVMIGTPAYMSPEQAEMSPLDVDTRTDVYSLGVLLYELLVSELPFQPAELRAAGHAEILRIIREVEPPSPSTRFSSFQPDAGSSISDQRRLDTKAMRRELQGDLDWITMKAIDKDPARRYASVSELAADLRRHLDLEPVSAGPPNVSYRARKMIRKHRNAFSAVAAFLLLLTGSLIATATLWARAEQALVETRYAKHDAEDARAKEEEQRVAAEGAAETANIARKDEEKQRQLAEANAKRAEAEALRAKQEAAKAKKIREFLQEMLSSVDPDQARGAALTVREVLDEAAATIDDELTDEPEIRAAIMMTIGRTYAAIGLRKRADELLKVSLELCRDLYGNDSLEAADILTSLASSAMNASTYEEREVAITQIRQALAIRQKLLGEDHEDTMMTKWVETQALWSAGGTLESFSMMMRWGIPVLISQFDPEEFPDKTADMIGDIEKLWGEGRNEDVEARVWHWQLELAKELSDLWAAGEHTAARELVRGHYTPFLERPLLRANVAIWLCDASSWYLRQHNDPDAVEPLVREAVVVAREVNGDQSMALVHALNGLARVLEKREDYLGAERLAREALGLGRDLAGEEASHVWESTWVLARSLARRNKFEESELLLRRLTVTEQSVVGSPSVVRYNCLWLVHVLAQQRKYSEAEEIARELLATMREAYGDQHQRVAEALSELGWVLEDSEQPARAEAAFREALAIRRKLAESETGDSAVRHTLADSLCCVGLALGEQGKHADAIPLLRESLTIRRGLLPQDHWLVFNTMSILGANLGGQGKFQEAEPLLLDGHVGLRKDPQAIPQQYRDMRLGQALERVVKFYDAWHEAEPDASYDIKAAEWRAKLSSDTTTAPQSASTP